MHFETDRLYHVFNQGNNKQQIFFSSDNYIYFLKKYRTFIAPFADTIAYCLMPNHFHFLIHANENSIHKVKIGSLYLTRLSNGIRQLLSSYAAAINKQENRSGSLLRQKTKGEVINNSSANYAVNAFHYIHLNPLINNLVDDLANWKFSSYLDYTGVRNGSLCNKEIAMKFINANWMNLKKDSIEAFENKVFLSV